MDRSLAYGFVAGLHLGRFTGIISNLIITGMVVYYYDPNFYNNDNFEYVKECILYFLKEMK